MSDSSGGLGSLSRAGLLAPDDVAGRVRSDLFVLTSPEGMLELGGTDRNEAVVWAYSTVGLLVESCGNGQPYARLTAHELAEALARQSSVFVALDVRHPDGVRYPEPDARDLPHAEELDEEPASAAVLWVPSQPVRPRDQRADLELHRDDSGRPMLLVYSSLERLRAGCGPYQAAVAIETHLIGEVARDVGAEGVVLNPELAEQARHTSAVRLGRTKGRPSEGRQKRGRTVGQRNPDRD
ncbi:SAV_915 family protein [Qaidamihabitans albus]|uniref:SAV_915 family protein n=1 Tax=Qaidamihabitans albus TaxID=2795733 RepID=UPI0018F27310|nr:SAV_915 family protein [Qaidamihabitans albus]